MSTMIDRQRRWFVGGAIASAIFTAPNIAWARGGTLDGFWAGLYLLTTLAEFVGFVAGFGILAFLALSDEEIAVCGIPRPACWIATFLVFLGFISEAGRRGCLESIEVIRPLQGFSFFADKFFLVAQIATFVCGAYLVMDSMSGLRSYNYGLEKTASAMFGIMCVACAVCAALQTVRNLIAV